MSSRNFEFRIAPQAEQRKGRFISPSTGTPIVIGAPVKADTAVAPSANELNLQEVDLATGAQAPVPGLSGIAYYVHKGEEGFAGLDPALSTFVDVDTCPLGKALQVISGDSVKVVFRNTNARTYLNSRTYANRTMVNEGTGGTTPNVNVGDLLTPGTGNDTAGYWAVTTSAANAWLRVVGVDDARGEVEAQLLF